MSFTTKAIFAALVLSLTPALASAQSLPISNYGPGAGGASALPGVVIGGIPLPGGVVGTLVQARDCGAERYQGLVGQHVSVAQSFGLNARYFTPDSPYGTMDYLPQRLNISAVNNYIIDRVYCG